MDPSLTQALPLVLPVLVLALVVRRSLRERELKAERLWIMPVLLLFVGGSTLYDKPPSTPLAIGEVAVAVAAGALAGWWRGRLTRITIDPETHDLTSQASPLGVLLIAGLFILRYGVRYLETRTGAALPGGAAAIADALLALSVVTVSVQRLEMWLRCRRLIAEAVQAKAARR